MEKPNDNVVTAPQKIKRNLPENCFKFPSVNEKVYGDIRNYTSKYLTDDIRIKIEDNPEANITYYGKIFEKPECDMNSTSSFVSYYVAVIRNYLIESADNAIEISKQNNQNIMNDSDNGCLDWYSDVVQEFNLLDKFGNVDEIIHDSFKLLIKSNPQKTALTIYTPFGNAQLKDVFEVIQQEEIDLTSVTSMNLMGFLFKEKDYLYFNELFSPVSNDIRFFLFSQCQFSEEGIELFDKEQIAMQHLYLVFQNCNLKSHVEMFFVFPNNLPKPQNEDFKLHSQHKRIDEEASIDDQ